MAAGSGQERRRRTRVRVNGEVRARIHSATTAPLIDISETGALVEVGGALRPGSQYVFRIPLPGGGGELTLRCRVVRCYIDRFERVGEDTVPRYRAAVAFAEVSEADHGQLLAHLRTYAPPSADGGLGDFDEELGR